MLHQRFNFDRKVNMKNRTTLRWLDHGLEVEEEFAFGSSDESEPTQYCEPTSPNSPIVEAVSINDTENQMIQIYLHDCLEKLGILKCISQKGAPPKKNEFPVYQTIDERFGESVNYETENLSEDNKRYNDISTIYSILHKTLEDLAKGRHYNSLIESSAVLKRMAKEEEALLLNEANSAHMVQELRLKLDTQSKSLDSMYREKMEELRKLELEYEDAIGYGNLEMRYIESWEAARRHQGQLVLSELENTYTDTVKTCELKSSQENKVHNDIVSYIEENSEDMQNEIQYWMDRFDMEVEARDAELLRLRMERDAQMEKFVELKDSFEERKLFIEEWDKILRQRKIEAEIFATQTRAATKIQAWWRGVMFRKKLGPYRKKKGKGKGKAKENAKVAAKGKKK